MVDTILASAYMSESATDNGPAFSTFLQAVVSQKKTGVIDGKYNIRTPQVFTGLGQFTLISSEPNKIDKGQGPELNYTGTVTDQPLFKFIGCYNGSQWGDGNYGITINLLSGAKYGINMHVANVAGEKDFSLHQWTFNNVFISAARDGGAGWRLTGDYNNDTHIFNGCSGYIGQHIKGVKTLNWSQTGTLTNGTYYNVPIDKSNYTQNPVRATIVISGGSVTSVTVTAQGFGYTVGDALVIKSGFADSDSILSNISGNGATLSFTVASIITDMDINVAPFSNQAAGYNAPRISVANYNNYTPWVIGTSIPTTGTWTSGQEILNWTAAAGYGTPNAWYCTSSGTFGSATEPTFATVPNGLGGLGLGDPMKGAALVEVDNINSVGLVFNACNFGQGAQALRLMRGRARLFNCNYGPNTDVDIFQQDQVVVIGGWTEQSNRFLFEPYAQTASSINIQDMKMASFPYVFATLNGYSQQATNNLSFAPVWTNRWNGISVINSTIEAGGTLPKKPVIWVNTTYQPPVSLTAGTMTRNAGAWDDGTHGRNINRNVMGWLGQTI